MYRSIAQIFMQYICDTVSKSSYQNKHSRMTYSRGLMIDVVKNSKSKFVLND